MSSLSKIDKEIENYKRLITDIAELFLKYLLFKKDNKQLSLQVIKGFHIYYLDFKFMRLKLLYGTYRVWDNNLSSSDQEKENYLNELEKAVFGEKIDIGSDDRIKRTSRKLKILPPNIGIA